MLQDVCVKPAVGATAASASHIDNVARHQTDIRRGILTPHHVIVTGLQEFRNAAWPPPDRERFVLMAGHHLGPPAWMHLRRTMCPPFTCFLPRRAQRLHRNGLRGALRPWANMPVDPEQWWERSGRPGALSRPRSASDFVAGERRERRRSGCGAIAGARRSRRQPAAARAPLACWPSN